MARIFPDFYLFTHQGAGHRATEKRSCVQSSSAVTAALSTSRGAEARPQEEQRGRGEASRGAEEQRWGLKRSRGAEVGPQEEQRRVLKWSRGAEVGPQDEQRGRGRAPRGAEGQRRGLTRSRRGRGGASRGAEGQRRHWVGSAAGWAGLCQLWRETKERGAWGRRPSGDTLINRSTEDVEATEATASIRGSPLNCLHYSNYSSCFFP